MEERKGSPDDAPHHLMYLVDVVRRRFGEAIRIELADHPYTDVRRSELRLLLLVTPAGTSLSELADLTGITKQSLSEFVERLQRAGYLTTETNPADRRVKLIRATERGEAARQRILAAGQAVEDAWRSQVGPNRFDTMREVLTDLSAE
jgi:DNA-binding MarR family transcriptional regulator